MERTISTIQQELNDSLEVLNSDLAKYNNGEGRKGSAADARKALQTIKVLSQELRVAIQESKKA